ncbi:hypothetical protein ABVF61_05310 [Roseibium sp. HPY-6]|uniref:hypothetical protein n=1 Tax=Roseibium sp. HPY-6 TaxID=3229852 RepID=UPI00338D4A27
MKNPNLVKIALVLSVLWIGTGATDQSTEYAQSFCPTHEEWASTLKGDSKQLFWLFAKRAFTTSLMERIVDDSVPDSIDEEMTRLFWLAGIHSIRITEPDQHLKGLTLLLHGKSAVTNFYDKTVLEEIGSCISGTTKTDCAEMAFGKGYISGLEAVVSHEYVSKLFNDYRIYCKLPLDSSQEDVN